MTLFAVALNAYGRLAPAKKATPAAVPVASKTSPILSKDDADKPSKERVQTVRFALYDVGIYPREAHVQEGMIAIAVEDLSGGTQGLVVERQTESAREHVKQITRGEHHGRGKEMMKLKAGTYEVYDQSRPQNRATLVVEP